MFSNPHRNCYAYALRSAPLGTNFLFTATKLVGADVFVAAVAMVVHALVHLVGSELPAQTMVSLMGKIAKNEQTRK